MKYILTLFAALFVTIEVQARVLRVNNSDGSAPYSKMEDAINAAVEGDTIMIDGSANSYGSITLDKRLVLIGNGYNLVANGISTEATLVATVYSVTVNAAGCVIQSLCVSGDVYGGNITINAPKVIVNRCYLGSGEYSITMGEGADNCIIHQNRIRGNIGSIYYYTSNHQITNNLLNNIALKGILDSYVAYNTSRDQWGDGGAYLKGNKFEKNLVYTENFGNGDNDNTYVDNYSTGNLFVNAKNEVELKAVELPAGALGKGCFAGDDPFVISGLPSGPMIESLDVPTSVEAGGTMTVRVKIGSIN